MKIAAILLIFLSSFQTSKVRFRVWDYNKKPVACEVRLYKGEKLIFKTKTKLGFEAENIPYGTYRFVSILCGKTNEMEIHVMKPTQEAIMVVDTCEGV